MVIHEFDSFNCTLLGYAWLKGLFILSVDGAFTFRGMEKILSRHVRRFEWSRSIPTNLDKTMHKFNHDVWIY